MKRFALTLVAMALVVMLHAQISPMGGDHLEVVGRNLLTNRDIVAYKQTFDVTVHHVSFDTVTNTALVRLWDPSNRDSRKHADYDCVMVYYDLSDRAIKWRKPINLLDEGLSKLGSYLFYEKRKTTYLLNRETGEEHFTVGKRVRPFFSSSRDGWLICATMKGMTWGIKDFRKVDLNTNQVLWKRKLTPRADLKVLAKINDSTYVFVGEGIHTVSLKDGTGWDYGLKTEEYEDSRPRQVRSRPLVDSTSIYMAGVKRLIKLDHQGQLQWETHLPDKKTSHSLIAKHDDCIILINQGYAEYSLLPYQSFWTKWGRPFLASYDAQTGELRYMHERKVMVDYALDARIKGDVVYVLYADKEGHQSVESYDIVDGHLLKKKDISQVTLDKVGMVTSFVGPDYFTKADSVLKPLHEMDTLGVFLEADKGIVHIDVSLLQADVVDFGDLYIYMGRHGDLRFFSYHNKVYAYDLNFHEVATFDLHDVYCTESEIYSIKGNTLLIINRDQLRMEQ